jgi:2'-5' RNA ligase
MRLFVAVYPPVDVTQRLLGELAHVPLPAHRQTPAAQVHATLQFIGETPARQLRTVVESVERSCSGLGPFELCANRLATLPVAPPVRLIAAMTTAPPTLLELQRRLAQRLSRGWRDDAGRAFVPHLTLARFPLGTPCEPLTRPLDVPPFTVSQAVVVESRLRTGGAEHSTVATIALNA